MVIDVVQALDRLGKQCMMQLSEHDLRFTMTSEHTDGEQAFVEIAIVCHCHCHCQ
jgi:hypothetical protein